MVRFIYGLVVASLATTLVSSAYAPQPGSSLGKDLSCYTRDYTPVCCTSGEKKRTYAKQCQAPKSIQATCETGRCITGCTDFHIKTETTCVEFVSLDGKSNTCEWNSGTKRCGYQTAAVVDFDETPNKLQVCRESYTTCWTTGSQSEDGCIGPLQTCVANAWNIASDEHVKKALDLKVKSERSKAAQTKYSAGNRQPADKSLYDQMAGRVATTTSLLAVTAASATADAAKTCKECVLTAKTKKECLALATTAYRTKLGRDTVSLYQVTQALYKAAMQDYADKRKKCSLSGNVRSCFDQARSAYKSMKCEKSPPVVTEAASESERKEVENKAKEEAAGDEAAIVGAVKEALNSIPPCKRSVIECNNEARKVAEAVTGVTNSSNAEIQEKMQNAAKDVLTDNFRNCVDNAGGAYDANEEQKAECRVEAANEYGAASKRNVSEVELKIMLHKKAALRAAEIVLECEDEYMPCIRAAKKEMDAMTGTLYNEDDVKKAVKETASIFVASKLRDCQKAMEADCNAIAREHYNKLFGRTETTQKQQDQVSDAQLRRDALALKQKEYRERMKAYKTLADADTTTKDKTAAEKDADELKEYKKIRGNEKATVVDKRIADANAKVDEAKEILQRKDLDYEEKRAAIAKAKQQYTNKKTDTQTKTAAEKAKEAAAEKLENAKIIAEACRQTMYESLRQKTVARTVVMCNYYMCRGMPSSSCAKSSASASDERKDKAEFSEAERQAEKDARYQAYLANKEKGKVAQENAIKEELQKTMGTVPSDTKVKEAVQQAEQDTVRARVNGLNQNMDKTKEDLNQETLKVLQESNAEATLVDANVALKEAAVTDAVADLENTQNENDEVRQSAIVKTYCKYYPHRCKNRTPSPFEIKSFTAMIQRKSLAGRAQSSGSGVSSRANPTATETMNKRADLIEKYRTFPGKQDATMEELDVELQIVKKNEIKNVLNANSAIKRKDETKQQKETRINDLKDEIKQKARQTTGESLDTIQVDQAIASAQRDTVLELLEEDASKEQAIEKCKSMSKAFANDVDQVEKDNVDCMADVRKASLNKDVKNIQNSYATDGVTHADLIDKTMEDSNKVGIPIQDYEAGKKISKAEDIDLVQYRKLMSADKEFSSIEKLWKMVERCNMQSKHRKVAGCRVSIPTCSKRYTRASTEMNKCMKDSRAIYWKIQKTKGCCTSTMVNFKTARASTNSLREKALAYKKDPTKTAAQNKKARDESMAKEITANTGRVPKEYEIAPLTRKAAQEDVVVTGKACVAEQMKEEQCNEKKLKIWQQITGDESATLESVLVGEEEEEAEDASKSFEECLLLREATSRQTPTTADKQACLKKLEEVDSTKSPAAQVKPKKKKKSMVRLIKEGTTKVMAAEVESCSSEEDNDANSEDLDAEQTEAEKILNKAKKCKELAYETYKRKALKKEDAEDRVQFEDYLKTGTENLLVTKTPSCSAKKNTAERQSCLKELCKELEKSRGKGPMSKLQCKKYIRSGAQTAATKHASKSDNKKVADKENWIEAVRKSYSEAVGEPKDTDKTDVLSEAVKAASAGCSVEDSESRAECENDSETTEKECDDRSREAYQNCRPWLSNEDMKNITKEDMRLSAEAGTGKRAMDRTKLCMEQDDKTQDELEKICETRFAKEFNAQYKGKKLDNSTINRRRYQAAKEDTATTIKIMHEIKREEAELKQEETDSKETSDDVGGNVVVSKKARRKAILETIRKEWNKMYPGRYENRKKQDPVTATKSTTTTTTTTTTAAPQTNTKPLVQPKEKLTELTLETAIQDSATTDMSNQIRSCRALKNKTCTNIGKTFEKFELIHENDDDLRLKDNDKIKSESQVYEAQANRLVTKQMMADGVEKCATSKDCATFQACMKDEAHVLTDYKTRAKEMFEADVRDAAEDYIMQLASYCMQRKAGDEKKWKNECQKEVQAKSKLVCLEESYEDSFFRGAKTEMSSLSKCTAEEKDDCIQEIFNKAQERNPGKKSKEDRWSYVRFGAQAHALDAMVDKKKAGGSDSDVLATCRITCKNIGLCGDTDTFDTEDNSGKSMPLCEQLNVLVDVRIKGGDEAKLKVIEHPTVDVDVESNSATSITEVSVAFEKASGIRPTESGEDKALEEDKVSGERPVDFVDHTIENIKKTGPSQIFQTNVVDTFQLQVFDDKPMGEAIEKTQRALGGQRLVAQTRRILRFLANEGSDTQGAYVAQTKTQGAGNETNPKPWWKRLMEAWAAVLLCFMCLLAVIVIVVVVRKRRKAKKVGSAAMAKDTKDTQILPVVNGQVADDGYGNGVEQRQKPLRRMSREERKSLPLMKPPPNANYMQEVPVHVFSRPKVVVGNSAGGW